MNKISRLTEQLERLVLVLLFTLLVGLTSAQIFLRNFFDSGMVWADDAIKVLVLWIAMSGALYATRGANHISIDVLSRFLSATWLIFIRRLLFLLSAILCGAAAWFSFQFVLLEFEDPFIAFLNIPTWLTQAIIPLALLLMSLRFFALVVWIPKGKEVSLKSEEDNQKGYQK